MFFTGLTELADRFPSDFTSLLGTFRGEGTEKETREAKASDISAMDILNLANLITEVRPNNSS